MKNHSIRTIVALAAVVALPLGIASAEEEKGKGKGKGRPGAGGPGFQPPKFGDIDTDSNGDVDSEEWTAFQVKMAKERAERSFKFIAGDDGKITEEELKRMAQRRGGGPKGPGPGTGDRKGKGPGGKKGDSSSGEGKKPKRPEIEE